MDVLFDSCSTGDGMDWRHSITDLFVQVDESGLHPPWLSCGAHSHTYH